MQRYTFYLYLETVLHVSGGTSTHHQVRIQLYLQHLVFVTPLLLSAAIVYALYPLNKMLDGFENMSEHFEEKKNLLLQPGYQPWTVHPVA
jgi:hypothetical protein